MSPRSGRHASPDNTSFYKSLVWMILGIIGVGVVVFGLLYVLADSGDPVVPTTPPTAGETTLPDTSTTSTTDPSTTSSTSSTSTTVPVRSPGEVRVQVLNSMGLAGAAGRFTNQLADAGYQTLQAADYSPELEPSRVWYRPGFSAEANILLEFIPDARVEELPDPDLSEGADVVIVLGTGYEE